MDEETENDCEGCDVEFVAVGQLEPVKAVDTAPVESDCTSERCSCDKPNHSNLLHKQLKGNRVLKQSRSLCGTWFKDYSWLLFCETREFFGN